MLLNLKNEIKEGITLRYPIQFTKKQERSLRENNEDIVDLFKKIDRWVNTPSSNGQLRLR